MKLKPKQLTYICIGLLIIAALSLLTWQLHRVTIPVLEPKGIVGQKEKQLMTIAVLLAVIVVVPVFVLLFGFAWKYRASNTKATYSPELEGSTIAETVWWLIPSAIILVLSVLAWTSSHSLDPYKPLASTNKPITIQVVALDWKWLFIYPAQGIATVNYIQFPQNTPVNFQITSDTVMNSFWIPQLGGQVYAMPGMQTQLHLMASTSGSYAGSSANISGEGFAGMKFVAKATSEKDFNTWVSTTQHKPQVLDQLTYASLTKPTENTPMSYYGSVDHGLYDTILVKYMEPEGSSAGRMNMDGMQMSGMNM